MRKQSEWNRLKCAVLDQNPGLFAAFELSLTELHTIVFTFSEKRKHDLTQHALSVIEQLLQRYLLMRNGALRIPNSVSAMFQAGDMTFDPLLTRQLEQLNSHGRRALASGEQELLKQVMSTLSNLMIFSVSVEPAASVPGESSVASFVAAYHWGLLKDAALKRQDDVALEGADQMLTLARTLIGKSSVVTASSVVQNLESAALISILSANDVVLGSQVRVLSLLLRSNASSQHPTSHLTRDILRSLEKIVLGKLEQGIGLDYPQVNFSLGPFLSVTENSSLAHTMIAIANATAQALHEKNYDRANRLMSAYGELNDTLWKYFTDIGVAAARRETFLPQFIYVSVHEILKVHFWLVTFLSKVEVEESNIETARMSYRVRDFQEKLEDYINWQTIGIFSRIVPVAIENNKKFLDEILDTLFDATMLATEATMELAVAIQEQIARICEKLMDKQFMYEGPRKSVYIAKIGAFAAAHGNEYVQAASVNTYTTLLRQWLDMYPEQPDFVGSFGSSERELLEEIRNPSFVLNEAERRWAEAVQAKHIRVFFMKVEENLSGENRE